MLCHCDLFNKKLNGTSGQRELWGEECGSLQPNAEKAGHAGGEVKAMSHTAA